MWGIFIRYPCVGSQRAQHLTLCEDFSFLLLTSWLANVRKSPTWKSLIVHLFTYLYSHFGVQPSKMSGAAINAFIRFIDGNISPFTEWFFFPIQHKTVDLSFPLWLWQWVLRKVCKLLGKDSEYLWSEDHQNRAYPDVQDTSKTDLKDTLQVLITAGAVAVLGREDVQSLFVDFFNVSAHHTNFLKSTSNGHASRFSLQRWATF